MRRFLLKVFANSVAFYFAAYLFPAIKVNNVAGPIIAGLVLAIINVSLRPLLVLILSPLVLITVGLFTVVINAWMIMFTGTLTGHMISVPGFWLSVAVSLIVSLFNIVIDKLEKKDSARIKRR